MYSLYTGATIGFNETSVRVDEADGEVTLIVASLGDKLADTAEVVVRVYTSPGTATTCQ